MPTSEQRKLVQVLAANGTLQAIIARNVGPHGIDEKTLHKHFAAESALIFVILREIFPAARFVLSTGLWISPDAHRLGRELWILLRELW